MEAKKKTYILAAVLLVLVVVVILISDRGTKTTTEKNFEKQFFKVDSALVDKIEFEHQGKKITIVKSGIEWLMTEPVNYPTQPGFIQNSISNLKNYQLASIVSKNADNKSLYGFNDSTTVKVTVYQGGAQLGSFLVGGAGRGASQSFLKKIDSDEIYLADDFLSNNFAKTVNDWRSKFIISITKGNVKSIEFTGKDNFKAIRDTANGKFFIGKDSVNAPIFEGVLNLLNNFNTQTFYDSALSPTLKPTSTVIIDWGKITEFKFYPVDEKVDNYYIKVSDINQIFKVERGFAENLIKSKADLLKK
jgi:hypothetical protein